MAHAIGIDLGTTEIRAAVYEASGGEEACASLLRLEKQELRMSAAVGIDADGELIAGDRARRLQITRPRSIIRTPLALLGARFDDLDLDSWAPLRLVRDALGDARVRIGERTLAPVQLVAAQLLGLRQRIEEASAEPLPPITLTVPAGLGNNARRGLIDACTIAGVHLQRLLPATTAAAIEIHAQGNFVDEPNIAICDLGGGSFSAAIVEFREGGITVLGSASAVDAGARDIDRRLAERLAEEAAIACENPSISDDPVAFARLLDASEKAKIGLSDARERAVYLPFLSADASGTKHLETLISQVELEERIEDLIQRWIAVVHRALADSNRTLADLSDVHLIGRGSHLPLLQDRLEAALERSPNLRWQDASAGPITATTSNKVNRTGKASKAKKADLQDSSEGDADTDTDLSNDSQDVMSRVVGRGRSRYPVAFGAARMAAMLARDPTIDVLEIDDVLGRPITLERGVGEPPAPPKIAPRTAPEPSAQRPCDHLETYDPNGKLNMPAETKGSSDDDLSAAKGLHTGGGIAPTPAQNKSAQDPADRTHAGTDDGTDTERTSASDSHSKSEQSDDADRREGSIGSTVLSDSSDSSDSSAPSDSSDSSDGVNGSNGINGSNNEDQDRRAAISNAESVGEPTDDLTGDLKNGGDDNAEFDVEDRPDPELLFAATTNVPTSHSELFEAEGDGATAHFHLREGLRDRHALGEHVLRGRQMIDVTFKVDINGILSLAFRQNFRGKEAQLYVLGGGGMTPEEVRALAAQERAKEEVLRKKRRTQELTLRLKGLHERGSKVLSELQAGIPEGDRIQLRATLQAMHDAVVTGSLEALEAADTRLRELLGELPRAIQEAISTPVAPENQPASAAST